MMEGIGVVNVLVLGGVCIATARLVDSPRQRKAIWLWCVFFAALTVAGVLVNAGALDVLAALDWGAVAIWLLYVGGGIAVLAGIGAALRGSGATRFAWRQGRYQKYKSYRRI